ncbi:ATPase [Sphingomonas alba]|uniref:ATPase n=1 Tax=Sphingomonas alba TaxID=2908208 RepID=A0ABT0RL00_9SPHN|nr:ATPase [Sphingomonas alba]MCL6683248.1 ATPase [Sphingomonas alba]
MRSILSMGLAMLSAPTTAEVVSADAHGFEVQESVSLVVPPAQAYAAFGRIGSWWNPEHSYSGNSANLRLALQAGGCFCESDPKKGGGVEHMRVSVVIPGERIVMTGSLGPLLYQAATGVMDVKFDRIAGGTKVTLNYRAAGFAKGDADKLAPLVDSVLADQVKRYRAFAAKGGGK